MIIWEANPALVPFLRGVSRIFKIVNRKIFFFKKESFVFLVVIGVATQIRNNMTEWRNQNASCILCLLVYLFICDLFQNKKKQKVFWDVTMDLRHLSLPFPPSLKLSSAAHSYSGTCERANLNLCLALWAPLSTCTVLNIYGTKLIAITPPLFRNEDLHVLPSISKPFLLIIPIILVIWHGGLFLKENK